MRILRVIPRAGTPVPLFKSIKECEGLACVADNVRRNFFG